ncbi:hypothetical protein [Lysobacter silvisoli]|uniref:Uncharacterized protein n=1 Tax=Lysobacter silvisoli TaxID=2293254 RepID=A0A371K4L3_9GAMM|nr:hypothetical protein [Lysobacter silvisoli]RDZ28873.1 hypothetical protein DX914_07130 [Lysobacter silvisoli]
MRRKSKILIALLAVALPAAAVGVGFFGSNTTGLAPESMRGEMAQDIVERWSPYVQRQYGAAAAGWGDRMEATMQSTDIANLEAAASAPSFEQMNAALLGAGMGVANSQPSVQPMSLGAPGEDLVYTPLNPCRIVDTRVVGGPIAANGTRSFRAFTATDFTAQGGDASNCNLPQNVSALTVKITSVFPTGNGYFTAYPFDEAKPLASSLNYTTGMILSDESHIRLCRPACPSEFNVYSFAQSEVVIDVTGYFIEPEATAIDCTIAQESGSLALLSGLQTKDVQCPTGYTATGGGCGGVLGIGISNSQPMVVSGQPVGWQCDLVGSLLSVLGYQVNATCCRVPGR